MHQDRNTEEEHYFCRVKVCVSLAAAFLLRFCKLFLECEECFPAIFLVVSCVFLWFTYCKCALSAVFTDRPVLLWLNFSTLMDVPSNSPLTSAKPDFSRSPGNPVHQCLDSGILPPNRNKRLSFLSMCTCVSYGPVTKHRSSQTRGR